MYEYLCTCKNKNPDIAPTYHRTTIKGDGQCAHCGYYAVIRRIGVPIEEILGMNTSKKPVRRFNKVKDL